MTGVLKPELSNIWVREDHEHYVEPEWCSRRLFEEEPFEGNIYDPACGFGRICIAADGAGYEILSSDLVNRGYGGVKDFLAKPRYTFVDNIVSNPPFDIFKEFVTETLLVAKKKVALIWLVRTLPAAHWLFLTPRPSMPPGHVILRGEKPGGGKQDFCWLIWEQGYKGRTEIGWLHRDKS